jgi:glycosyltransferase involved in cell wall biosynthesis
LASQDFNHLVVPKGVVLMRWPSFTGGQQANANKFNALVEAIIGNSLSGHGLRQSSSPSGQQISLTNSLPIMAKLSGSFSPYSWQEQYATASGFVEGPSSGTNAYEVNGKSGLANEIVRLYPGASDWRFQWDTCCNTGCNGGIYLPVSVCCQSSTGPTGNATVSCVGPTGGSVPVSGSFHSTYTEGSGTYTFTISQPGYYSRTVTVNGVCGTSTTVPTIYLRPTRLTFDCASACGGMNGTTLTLGGSYTGVSVSISGDGAQIVTVDVPDISGTGTPPDYTATLSQNRYVSLTKTYSWGAATPGSFLWICSGTGMELFMNTLADCYVCCDGCDYPTTNYFSISTPIGSVIVPYDAGPVGITGTCTGYASDQCCSGTTSSISVPFTVNCNCIFQDYPSVVVAWNACLGTNIPCLNTACDGCGTGGSPYFQGLASVVWSSSSCSPYEWSGALVGETGVSGEPNPIPSCLEGTWTLTELACSPYESGVGTGSGTVSAMSLPSFPAFAQSDKIRVGFVSPCLVAGGAETWQSSLARSLDSRFVITGVAITGTIVDPQAVGAYRDVCPVAQGFEAVKTLARNVDILVTWGQRDYASAWRNDPNRPVLVSVSHLPPGPESYGDTSNVDGFVAVSQSALEAIPASSRSKAIIIPNAVDPSRLIVTRTRDEVREAWGVSPTDFVVGYLGRLSVEKNPAAMIELARECRDVQVVIVGDGGILEELRATSSDLPNCHLVEADHLAGDVLRAFDTLVVPSSYESFGLSIVEAASLGIPVVTTRVGVAGVVPGLTRMVEEATGPKLMEAIQEDRRDVAGTASRVSSAKQWVSENASIETFGRRWSDHLAGLPLRSRPRKVKAKGCGCGGRKRMTVRRIATR